MKTKPEKHSESEFGVIYELINNHSQSEAVSAQNLSTTQKMPLEVMERLISIKGTLKEDDERNTD